MLETLVAALALLPLWFGVVYVSRWHDLQHAAIAAARYAAFEAHASGGREDPARIEAVTRQRLFSRDPARFLSTGGAEPADLGLRPQWADHTGGQALLDRDAGPGVLVAAAPQPQLVARTEQRAFLLLGPARLVGDRPFDLQREAARAATVQVPLRHAQFLPEPMAGLRFTLTERLSLLVDSWSSGDPREVAARTEALSPVGEMRDLVRPLDPVRWAVSLFEPEVERLCLGRIEPDLVPADRLVGARGAALDLRTRPC